MLRKRGYLEFEQYAVVGENSGPNQAALYTGVPLTPGSRDIANWSKGKGKGSIDGASKSTSIQWLWDRLRDKGYITMKGEDSCVKNSNMVHSIDPQTHHGHDIQEMFCFHFSRPNCIGRSLAAEHLLNYTSQFIRAYSAGSSASPHYTPSTDSSDSHQEPPHRPWAAFAHFTDSHEDTMALAGILDEPLSTFLDGMLC